jgi:2-iminobutanoate/2-iminopropanoate deaminase
MRGIVVEVSRRTPLSLAFDRQPRPRFRYSPAVEMGPFVKTAGMVGLDPATGVLVPGGAEAEFRQILDNLTALAADNALRAADIVSATLYVTAFHRFDGLNVLWDGYFAAVPRLPARTAVGVSQLPLGAQVEAEFLFHRAAGAGAGRPS